MATNIGRIDLITKTKSATCIFELKLDQTAEAAWSQAEIKKYKERFLQKGKPILVIGVDFSSKSRNISDWKGALFSPEGKLTREFLPQGEE